MDYRIASVGLTLCLVGWTILQLTNSANPIVDTVPGFAVYLVGAILICLAILKEI